MKRTVESIKAKLLKISVEEKMAYQNIQTMFLLERMVARLTQNKTLFDKLVFKGGYVGLRIFHSPRYTIDLDALIKNADTQTILKEAISSAERDLEDGTWFRFEKDQDLQTLGEYGGLRLYFRGGIGNPPANLKKAQSIHLDLGIGDIVIPDPVQDSMAPMVEGEAISWKVYTIESATAEKLHTLIVRGSDNSRSKDIFDLYYFLPQCRKSILLEAITATFMARGDKLPSNILERLIQIDVELLKKGWKNAIAGLKDSPDFDLAFSTILDECKRIWS